MGMIYSPGVAGLTGQVQFNNSGVIGADNSLFWDNTNKRLGIGTSTPGSDVDLFLNNSSGSGRILINATNPLASGNNLFGVNYFNNNQLRFGFFGSGASITFDGAGQASMAGTWSFPSAAAFPSPLLAANNVGGSDVRLAVTKTGNGNDQTIFLTATQYAVNNNQPYLQFNTRRLSFWTRGTFWHSEGVTKTFEMLETGTWVFTGASSSTVPVIVKLAASPTSNVQEWQNSSGVTRASVTKDFELQTTTGSGAPTTTPADGATYVDTTNHRFYVRSGGTWKYTNLI